MSGLVLAVAELVLGSLSIIGTRESICENQKKKSLVFDNFTKILTTHSSDP